MLKANNLVRNPFATFVRKHFALVHPWIAPFALITGLFVSPICRSQNRAAADVLKDQDTTHLFSILAEKNGAIVFAHYYNGHHSTDKFNDQSLTKSIMSLLVGIAIEKGFIRSVEQKIADFFPQIQKDSDARKRMISIRDIMNQASGLYHEDLEHLGEYLRLPSQTQSVLDSPMLSAPGEVFHYNNAATHLLSAIITKSSGMDTRSFADKYLFSSLGIADYDWAKMNDGYYDGCGLLSIRMRSSDILKIGQLLLNAGKFNDRQIVPTAWVVQLMLPQRLYPTLWGFDHSMYGLCWYHGEFENNRILYGMGWGGQFLVIIPSVNAVVVINQDTADSSAVRQSTNFTRNMFPSIYTLLKK